MELVAYRGADYDTPLWVNPNSSDGRYHRAGQEMTQYWCLHPLGPWAELLRAHGVYDPADFQYLQHRVWAARLDLGDEAVAHITFENAGDFGIAPDALVDEDLTRCQDLGEGLREEWVALRVPSAALPGTENLVVFGPRAATAYSSQPIDVDRDVPVGISADRGTPPEDLAGLVRHRGDAHVGLGAWKLGTDLEPVPGVMALRA